MKRREKQISSKKQTLEHGKRKPRTKKKQLCRYKI